MLEEAFPSRRARPFATSTATATIPRSRAACSTSGAERLQTMDEGRIDLQVLSHTSPGTQQLTPDLAVKLARDANDSLARTIAAHPDRFAGFALLPIPDPSACLVELERAVTQLCLKGAMVHGLTQERVPRREAIPGPSSVCRQGSTSRSTSIRRIRIRPSSRRTIETTRSWRTPPGGSASRRRRKPYASSSPASSMRTRT